MHAPLHSGASEVLQVVFALLRELVPAASGSLSVAFAIIMLCIGQKAFQTQINSHMPKSYANMKGLGAILIRKYRTCLLRQ